MSKSTNESSLSDSRQTPFLPFWATPSYASGLIQGMGIAFASLAFLTQISADFYARYANFLGLIGVVFIIVGGLKARKATK